MSSGNDDNNQGDSGHSPDGGEHKAFRFTILNGEVTEVFEIKDGVPEPKSIDDGNETYTVVGTPVDGIEVVRTEVKPFGTEITRYADIDGDGDYNRISEQWQSASDAPGTGHFKFEDNLSYSLQMVMIILPYAGVKIAMADLGQMILSSVKRRICICVSQTLIQVKMV